MKRCRKAGKVLSFLYDIWHSICIIFSSLTNSLGIQKALTWGDGSAANPDFSFCPQQNYIIYLLEKHIYAFPSLSILKTLVISEVYELYWWHTKTFAWETWLLVTLTYKQNLWNQAASGYMFLLLTPSLSSWAYTLIREKKKKMFNLWCNFVRRRLLVSFLYIH